MPKAYRIKRFSHVTSAKRGRLLEESLVPILDESVENASDIQNFLKEGDLLIEYRESTKPLYLFKVKEYRHEPHIHLYVKHFIEAEKIYKLDKSYVTNDIHTLLDRANHLEALPPHVYDLFDRYHDGVSADLDERLRQLVLKLKRHRNTLTPIGKDVLAALESGRMTDETLKQTLVYSPPNIIDVVRESLLDISDEEWIETHVPKLAQMQWEHRENAFFDIQVYNQRINNRTEQSSPSRPSIEYVDPTRVTGAISKSALDTYMKNHDGQLPTVKEFDKYTKRFMSGAGQRRRRR